MSLEDILVRATKIAQELKRRIEPPYYSVGADVERLITELLLARNESATAQYELEQLRKQVTEIGDALKRHARPKC